MATYNIIYSEDTVLEDLVSALEAAGASLVKSFPSLHVLTIDASNTDFASISGIIDWEENVTTEAVPSAWHQLRVYTENLPMVSRYFAQNLGEGATIYLIDSGINTSHSEFANANIVNVHSYDETFTDELGHGTSIASLIVGETLGVAKNSTLKNVKISMGTEILFSDLLAAFDAVLTDHQLTNTVKVVNCSWVVTKSKILDMKITQLENAGLVVVAAAGNTGEAADNFSPVGLDSVLGVGASDAYDRVISWASGASSNWGPEVDVTAPGIDIEIAKADGTTGTASGTSLSAAIVSSVVAQYIVASPNLSAQQIQAQIVERASEDLLFRNESIYGTTPNRLVRALGVNDVFHPEQTQRINAQRGETTTHVMQFRDDIVAAINYTGVLQIGMPRINPDWMTFDFETKTITLTPPETVEPNVYRIYFEAVDAEGVRVSSGTYSVNVYITSPEENEGDEVEEQYFRLDGDTIVVMPAACSTNFCFSAGSCSGVPGKNYVCGCVSNGCGSQYQQPS